MIKSPRSRLLDNVVLGLHFRAVANRGATKVGLLPGEFKVAIGELRDAIGVLRGLRPAQCL